MANVVADEMGVDIEAVVQSRLLPEDDDALSYFCGGAVDAGVVEAVERPHALNSFLSSLNKSMAVSARGAGTKRSIETTSNASSEHEGGDSPTGGDIDAGSEDIRRRRRLERNRESARQSRRRKKQYLELLEGKVAQLTEEIEAARSEHLDSADSTLTALKNQMIAQYFERVAAHPAASSLAPSVEEELREAIQTLQERFGPHAEERRAVVNHHFQQLDSLLLPPYTRFLLWMSIQEDSFYTKPNSTAPASKRSVEAERKDSVATKEGLWAALSTEMGLTYEQEEKIKGYYRTSNSKMAKMERRKIAMAVTYLNQLKENMSERSEAVQTYADSIQDILTPDQAIRFQHWAMQNRSKHAATLKAKGLAFYPSPSVDPNAKISTILQKKDQDLTVEDVTSLLATLPKPSASQ